MHELICHFPSEIQIPTHEVCFIFVSNLASFPFVTKDNLVLFKVL